MAVQLEHCPLATRTAMGEMLLICASILAANVELTKLCVLPESTSSNMVWSPTTARKTDRFHYFSSFHRVCRQEATRWISLFLWFIKQLQCANGFVRQHFTVFAHLDCE